MDRPLAAVLAGDALVVGGLLHRLDGGVHGASLCSLSSFCTATSGALLLQTPQCQNRYGFLYAKYQDRVWWWEIIEMFRKLMFTSIIMFLSNAPRARS